jgi:hypothetical protein
MAEMNDLPDPAVTTPAPSPGRRSLFWPVVLIGAGVVALLFNVGWLDWEKVSRVYRFWPVLLIALGVAIILRRRLPGSVPTFFLAVLMILLLVLLGGWIAGLPGTIVGSSAPSVTSRFSALAGEVSAPRLDLSAGAATIIVRAGSTGGDLYRATVESPADEKPAVTLDSASGTLHVNLPGRTGFDWGSQNDHRTVDLTLSDRLPWVIGLNTGASQTSLDLSGLKVSSVTAESGASSVNLTLPKPTVTVPVHVAGGAMHLTIQRPAGTPVRVSGSGGASSMDVDGQHFGGLFQEGVHFTSPDYSTATGRYEISIESGASSIGIS